MTDRPFLLLNDMDLARSPRGFGPAFGRKFKRRLRFGTYVAVLCIGMAGIVAALAMIISEFVK